MMHSVRIYAKIDEKLANGGVYARFRSFKSFIEEISNDIIALEDLSPFLSEISHYRGRSIRVIRISQQLDIKLQSTPYCRHGITKTALINAILLCYLAKINEKKSDYSIAA